MRVAVLASGRGTNLQALIDAQGSGALPITLVGVFSDRAGCGALERARLAGIPGHAFAARDFIVDGDCDREAYDAALFDAVDAMRPDLVVCAGYLRMIGATSVQRHAGRMLNIHPSLLPKFRGLHTHVKALSAGEREHGASVHFVIPALDAGSVIAQVRVPVRTDDSVATLAARVLQREHPLLVACVGLFADGRIFLRGSDIFVDSHRLSRPLQLQADGTLRDDPGQIP
jgi:phosphoribosylglycinamide formyltransferase-1